MTTVKPKIITILGFAGQIVSVATSKLDVVVKSSIENIMSEIPPLAMFAELFLAKRFWHTERVFLIYHEEK